MITVTSGKRLGGNMPLLLLLSSACVLLCVDVTHAWRGCTKALMDECTGSIPVPMSLKPYALILSLAEQAPKLEHPVRSLYSIPPSYLINRTCAVYHGLRGCAATVERLCGYRQLRSYQDFRTSFNDLCSMIGRVSYMRNYKCLTNSTQLDTAVRSCLGLFLQAAGDISNTNISSTEHMVTICRANQALKLCSMQAVSKVCGQYSREFWFKFSFPSDPNLESQQYCDQEVRNRVSEANHPLRVNQSALITCADGSNIIEYNHMCDKESDCYNGQDELDCDYDSAPSRLSTPAIMGIIIAIIVLIIVVICVVKARKESAYSPANTMDSKDSGAGSSFEVKEKELEEIS